MHKQTGSLSPAKAEKVSKVEQVDADLALPTSKSTPSTRLGDYSTLLYGPEKVGKTTMASMFPKTVFLMFEPGGKALSIYQQPVTNWASAKKLLRLLERDRRFDTVVVDTVDIAFKMCERAMCRKLGIEHPSDEDWGKGWNKIRDEFTEWASTLMLLGKGVILISHAVEREIKQRNGERYHVVGPTMAGQARSVIQPMVDIWCYYQFKNGRRSLVIRGDDHITAGVRPVDRFLHNGKPLSEIDMGASSSEAYKNFVDAFANTYVPPRVAAPKKEG